MGSRASSRPRLVAEDTAWTEAAGEAAVLAEFADESAIVQDSAPAVAELEPYQRPSRGLRLLSPHTSMREIVRTVLVGCLSAMALGASFAIGFGYVWSDRSGAPTAPAADDVATPRPYQDRWWPTLPQAASPSRTASTPTPQNVKPPTPQAARSSADRPAPSVQASKSSRAQASSAVSPEATVADPNPEPAPTTADEAAVTSASIEESPLPSQPMLSAERGIVAAPVAPSLTVTPYPGSANAATELGTGTSVVHRAEADAVRQAIERYAAAYSHKDVGAMALVWPSVDVPGVARAFESVDRQALTLGDCRVTTAGNLATAVCPGQVRYVGRVGNRQLQERQGTWTIALERRGEAWQFVRLNVR